MSHISAASAPKAKSSLLLLIILDIGFLMKVDMKGEEQCKMKAKQSCSKENLKKCFKSYTVKIEKFLLYVCLLPLSSLTSRTTRLML